MSARDVGTSARDEGRAEVFGEFRVGREDEYADADDARPWGRALGGTRASLSDGFLGRGEAAVGLPLRGVGDAGTYGVV
jgi:hypothetical protein